MKLSCNYGKAIVEFDVQGIDLTGDDVNKNKIREALLRIAIDKQLICPNYVMADIIGIEHIGDGKIEITYIDNLSVM